MLATATQDLGALVAAGRFRQECGTGLRSVAIAVPPLRERREDMLGLAYHLLHEELGAGKDIPGITPEAQSALEAYPWPGKRAGTRCVLHQPRDRFPRHPASHATPCRHGFSLRPDGSASRVPHSRRGSEARGKSLRAFLREKE